MKDLRFEYHKDIDMLEVEGLHFSGDYFRDLASFQKGDFLVIKRDGSTLYLERRPTKRAVDGLRRLLAWASEVKNNLLALLRGTSRRN